MSLKSASSLLDGATENPTTVADSLLTSAVPTTQRQAKQLGATATKSTSLTTPGEFPGEKTQDNATVQDTSSGPWYAPMTAWFRDVIPSTLDWFEGTVKWLLAWIFPPPRQAALFEAALRRPYAISFLVCQLICCGVPFLVFLAGTFVFAAVAALLWAILSFVILGPIFLVASMMGVYLWSWGLVLYAVIKWVDGTFLSGVISKFWLSQVPPKDQPQDVQEDRDEGTKGTN
ncbi:hypothetical protein BDV37DRAFT_260192 [Aspergillus pseudonomiae]|uniref:Uncharacterized protein n=1 Tax=Aspergillus pseudonomiae TaxID=1506151 RepID=A0A5N7CZD0_9EURO|nr:uncharacterized protein BDV37DRAFT_260192 [Aspergillus pseudonomiae]KAE8399521.1 hypothetical protein BDV37DRAFT_260192 [Aspergillus pseudonomiae]